MTDTKPSDLHPQPPGLSSSLTGSSPQPSLTLALLRKGSWCSCEAGSQPQGNGDQVLCQRAFPLWITPVVIVQALKKAVPEETSQRLLRQAVWPGLWKHCCSGSLGTQKQADSTKSRWGVTHRHLWGQITTETQIRYARHIGTQCQNLSSDNKITRFGVLSDSNIICLLGSLAEADAGSFTSV